MLENFKSSLLSLSSDDLVDDLESESRDYDTMETSTQALPVPDYLFYDRFGKFGTARSNSVYQVQVLALLLLNALISALSVITVIRKSGFRVGLQNIIYPSIHAFVYIFSTFTACILLIFFTSFVKTKVNPGSTYGFAELSLIITYVLVIFVITTFAELSLRLWTLDRISTKLDEEVTLALKEDEMTNSQSDFLQVGLFLFWTFTALLAFIGALKGYTVFFFFFDLSIYSSLGLFTSLMLQFTSQRRNHFHKIFNTLCANIIPSLCNLKKIIYCKFFLDFNFLSISNKSRDSPLQHPLPFKNAALS
jgi:hypothetical protein